MRPPIVPEQPVLIVPEDGLRWLLAACAGKHFEGRRDTAIVIFLLDTGARRAELVGLRMASVSALVRPPQGEWCAAARCASRD
jgi:integrase/recombinase XerC